MTMANVAEANATAAPVSSYFSGKQWQQVLGRDHRADGQFVYAVKSTGIYCRPSCASRRPARKQVAFFPSPTLAEAAGYRACKRCEPKRADARPDPQEDAVRAAAQYLRDHADERTPFEVVARVVGIGRLPLLRGFKRVLGVSPGEFAREQRRTKFKEKVRKPEAKITDAIYDAGFGSSSRLYESSNEVLGMKPKTMREGGAGVEIRYTTASSPLGRMLVAATDAGVCSIAFGKDDAALLAELRGRYKKAEIVRAKSTDGWLAEAVDYIASQMSEHPRAAKFPLDVRATAFQQRVWRALQQIPRGETRSYGQIACELGMPKAARAVGSAIGSNPVAVVVPCHRAIHGDGTIAGYHWGVERKKKLLAAEKSS